MFPSYNMQWLLCTISQVDPLMTVVSVRVQLISPWEFSAIWPPTAWPDDSSFAIHDVHRIVRNCGVMLVGIPSPHPPPPPPPPKKKVTKNNQILGVCKTACLFVGVWVDALHSRHPPPPKKKIWGPLLSQFNLFNDSNRVGHPTPRWSCHWSGC